MIAILLLAFLGLLDSGYLVYKVRRHEAPVCPLGQSCDFVLQSRYNHIFGLKNEFAGFLFYVGVTAGVVLTLLGIIALPWWLWALGLGGGLAVSLALTAVQVFILRAYCSWCLASAGINALLFIAIFMTR